jgi:biotin-(acetyl-CoA carboxylase) ligase
LDIIDRRSELLKLEGLGVSRVDIVKRLSEKYSCTPRSIYNDFETRANWQPSLQGAIKTEDVMLKIINRLEQIYNQAAKHAISSTDVYAQLQALNVMLKANSQLTETAAVQELRARIKAIEEKIAKLRRGD